MKKKQHPFGPSALPTDVGVMPPRKRRVIEDVPEENKPTVNFEDMTRADLYTLARDKELSVTTRSTKDELIAALEKHATGAD
jgi:hypothetical protein